MNTQIIIVVTTQNWEENNIHADQAYGVPLDRWNESAVVTVHTLIYSAKE